MERTHQFNTKVSWTGNLGKGTGDYRAYTRDHDIFIAGKPPVRGSSDPAFRGDPSRHTPEDMLISSLSACHMLWYLHLCATNNVTVTAYTDDATGVMQENADGSGQFTSVTLRPKVTVSDHAMVERASALHTDAHRMCFIARSINFNLSHIPEIIVQPGKALTDRT